MQTKLLVFFSLLGLVCALTGCFDAGTTEGPGSGRDASSTLVGDAAPADAAVDAPAPRMDTGPAQDTAACPATQSECDGQCVDLSSDPDNCGSCGHQCETSAAHSVPACQDAACASQCEAGWVDADGDDTNGCELACTPSHSGIEICDGVDNDCNGVVDDGFDTGPCTVGVGACATTGQYECVNDQTAQCNATAGTPGEEVCDGIDNDCDGQVDEDAATDAIVWYLDADGDGYGDPSVHKRACDQPSGYVADGSDCDDSDPSGFAAVLGFADADGDGYTDGAVQSLCTDGTLPSGFVATQMGQDCDDTDATINPGVDEVCGDGVDNNCDKKIDDSTAVDAKTWYVDCDGDGYAADVAGARTACTKPSAPTGCSSSSATWTDLHPGGGTTTDCNDDVREAHPGQTAWFDHPMGSNPSSVQTPDWDYNCDGTMNFRWSNTGATCQSAGAVGNFQCDGSAGWVSQYVEACGYPNDYQICQTTGRNCVGSYCTSYSCDSSIVQRTQTCH